jgi:hypothetical protein
VKSTSRSLRNAARRSTSKERARFHISATGR